jgi:cell division protease FtsH
MKNLLKNFLIFFLVFLIITGFFSLFSEQRRPRPEEIDLSQLIREIEREQVERIEVEGNRLNITLIDGKRQFTLKEPGENLSDLLRNYQVKPEKLEKITVLVKDISGGTFWLNTFLPFLLPFLIIGLFIFLIARQIQKVNMRAMMFGQAGTKEKGKRDKKDKVTFKDVAGVKEAKEELQEVVEFLRSPKRFTQLGARVPKGVLLVGPPGTGKTLLARAVANEANVPFYHMAGSEFMELFVGVGASRVRSLFARAKKNAPAILFIDELDAIGRQRGLGIGGAHDEREQTLNQILTEMDGFEPEARVIVLAATNRPDVLDPALLRPGRFDRRIILDLPDIKEREEILKIHAKGKVLATSVNLHKVAERTSGFSGADLANLLNEAAILAVRRKKEKIGMSEILDSIEKVLLGPERKSHILSEREKKITAYHEAGHALVAHFLPHCDPVQKVSIISRGRTAGYIIKTPAQDKYLHSKSEFLDNLAAYLAGYAAEREIFNDVTTGAANDLKEATQLARKLVTEYGMSEALGPRTFGQKEELVFLGREISEQRDYSDETALRIDKEVSRFIKEAYDRAVKIIQRKKKYLEKIVKVLLKKETIEKEEFEKLFV